MVFFSFHFRETTPYYDLEQEKIRIERMFALISLSKLYNSRQIVYIFISTGLKAEIFI